MSKKYFISILSYYEYYFNYKYAFMNIKFKNKKTQYFEQISQSDNVLSLESPCNKIKK